MGNFEKNIRIILRLPKNLSVSKMLGGVGWTLWVEKITIAPKIKKRNSCLFYTLSCDHSSRIYSQKPCGIASMGYGWVWHA